jgi:XRE family aerobic/anaerobic benzoate catabolism transcriptional regulator
MSLNEIFDLSGQRAYRRFERRALERVTATMPRAVIATGGSLPTEPGTFEHLLAHCYTVWVKASPAEHMARVQAQGDMRPMAGNGEAMDDLKRILAQRDALYRQADAVLDTSGKTPAQSLENLMALVRVGESAG